MGVWIVSRVVGRLANSIVGFLALLSLVAEQVRAEATEAFAFHWADQTHVFRISAPRDEPPTDAWAEADGEKYGLKSGARGHWVTESFKVTCWGSDKLFLRTYLYAVILNRPHGNPKCDGGILEIKNSSSRWPAYFGQSGVINRKIEPNETISIELPIYRSKSDHRNTVETIAVKYWREGAMK